MQSLSDTESRKDALETLSKIELCEFAERRLYTAVVSDSMDQLGVRHQAMREYLRPVHGSCTFAGWARTISCSDVYHVPEDPYTVEILGVAYAPDFNPIAYRDARDDSRRNRAIQDL